MDAPQEFLDRLRHAFDGKLRIRWSAARDEWHIEQRVGQRLTQSFPIGEADDDLIRARDGFMFVMAVRNGDRMPCPSCFYKLTVPAFDTHDIRCPYCQLKGRQTRVVAGFWPLNDRLIDHLRRIDPMRGASSELAAQADRHNELLMQTAENDYSNQTYAQTEERYNRLVGIPQVGYTGKESAAV